MTLIQPTSQNSASLFNRILVGLLVLFLVGVVWLIFLYTDTVNTRHEITRLREDLQNTQVDNAALKDQLFARLGSETLEVFARDHGLVRDNAPYYLQLQSQWDVASR